MKTEDSYKLIKAFKALGLSIITIAGFIGFMGFVIWAVWSHPIITLISVAVIIIVGLAIEIYDKMD